MTTDSPKRAIITGASSGIGRATALAFARAGIHVALVARSRDKLAAVAAEAAEAGVEAKVYDFDLARVAAVKEKMENIAADFGAIDILVNNAGMGYTRPLVETPSADWQRVIDLNLTSVFECLRAIVPGMRDRGRGTIVNISSIAAQTAFPTWGAYGASKAGLAALSRALNAEERANGIRTTTIYPGAIATPLWDTDTVQADFNRSAMPGPEVVATAILQVVLIPENAIVEELTIVPNASF